MNAYFSEMVDILKWRQGEATQFHGDATLVTFDVLIENSHHTQNTILAISKMTTCIDSRTFSDHRLRIRIGMDTGAVVAGATRRPSYTVCGNTINLIARLEVLKKDYGTRLLFPENTATLASDVISLHPVGDCNITVPDTRNSSIWPIQRHTPAVNIRTLQPGAGHPQHQAWTCPCTPIFCMSLA